MSTTPAHTPEDAHAPEDVRHALAQAESYPGEPGPVEVHETHISWVFVVGELVYKLKKPVVLDFLDYGTAARRRAMCEEEVRLNRRLAPDIYLGVRGVALDGDRAVLVEPDDERAVDHVVEMRRYDERGTLAAQLERGELRDPQIAAVARRLARFHADACAVRVEGAAALRAERAFIDNAYELGGLISDRAGLDRIAALIDFARGFAARHAAALERRAAGGHIREGHGDLRAEHVLVNEHVRVVDCVEFAPELRELDVSDDLAFLLADLAATGDERAGRRLIEAYRGAGGDPGEDWLIAFYAAHRSLVRAKVALVRAGQSSEKRALRERAGRLIGLAERFAWRARLPLAIVVCGLPASGKSALAAELARRSGLGHGNSDRIRKALHGLPATERATASAYSGEANSSTYERLGAEAAGEIVARGGVVIDATFRHRADRDAFGSGFRDAGPRLFVECLAPTEVRLARAGGRNEDPGNVSDADPTVVAAETSWDPLDDIAPERHVLLRSDRPISTLAAEATAAIDRRLGGLGDSESES